MASTAAVDDSLPGTITDHQENSYAEETREVEADYESDLDDRLPPELSGKFSDGEEAEAEGGEGEMKGDNHEGDPIGDNTELPAIDYILVYDPENYSYAASRVMFEKEIRKAGLKTETEKIGRKAFLKVFCPFDRLCHEAEHCNLEMDLANCPIEPSSPGCLDRFFERFETEHEVDFVSGPFERGKLELFEGHEDKLSFFRSSLRSLLVHRILQSLLQSDDTPTSTKQRPSTQAGHPTKKHGLPYLLMKGAYQDAFILHDQSIEDPYYLQIKRKELEKFKIIEAMIGGFFDPRMEMKSSWTKFSKFQPLWKIRNYFGEKIALYFAWQGVLLTFLWAPAFMGLAIFLYGIATSAQDATYEECKCWLGNTTLINGTLETVPMGDCVTKGLIDIMATDVLGVVKKAFNNTASPVFSLIMCIWGILFLTYWKRKNARVAYEWDCNNFEENEPDRPEFIGTDLVTDPITREFIWIFPGRKQFMRFLVSALVICCMVILVFLSIACCIVLKVVLRARWSCPPEEPPDGWQPICDPDKDNPLLCLFGGVILPSSLMAASVMMWGKLYAIIAVKLTDYENHQTQSDHQDALILKLFAFEFVNHYAALFYLAVFRPSEHGTQEDGVFGLGPEYQDTCTLKGGKCMSTLSFQVLLLMIAKPCLKFAQDILLPYGLRQVKILFKFLKLKRAASKIEDAARAVSDGEGGAEWHGGRLEEENETDDNALISRSYIEREWRKPPPGDFSLEEFTEKTMQFGYVVMFTAAFPLAPFVALIVNAVDLRIDARRLLWFNRRPVSHIAADIGMWEPILAFLNFCGVITNGFLVASTSVWAEEKGIEWRLFTMLFFEHLVFFAMFLIRIIIPNTPKDISLSIRREKIQVGKILADGFIPRSASGLIRMASTADRYQQQRRAPSCTFSIDAQIKRQMEETVLRDHKLDMNPTQQLSRRYQTDSHNRTSIRSTKKDFIPVENELNEQHKVDETPPGSIVDEKY